VNILSGLSNDQVLQRLDSRGATVILHGTNTEDGPIRATLSKAKATLKGWKNRPVGKVAGGKFSIKLASIPVGGPYGLRLEAGKQHVDVSSFFVGDVWILAGQSNMEGVGNMTGPAKSHALIRAFSLRREWRVAKDPLHLLAESPDACHAAVQCSTEVGEKLRQNAVKGVGAGLFFARKMLERSGGVPQGLICTAHGGTSMEQWSPERKHLGGQSLYASMLNSVRATGQPVAGCLWYQGESDANPQDAAQYTRKMEDLVKASRSDLSQPHLPWIIVQISRHFTNLGNPREWNSIQEQQRLLPEKINFFETVAAIDLPLDDGIHIGAEGFPRLADRLASAADRLVYKNKHEMGAPRFRSAQLVGSGNFQSMEVTFDCIQGGLCAKGEPSGFRLVSLEGTPLDVIFKTELRGNKAKLHLSMPQAGGFNFHYGHGLSPGCNITDARGFSLPVFGPVVIFQGQPKAFLPFLTQWNVTKIVPASKALDRITLPEVKVLGTTVKSYPQQGFVNEHAAWESKTGQMFFHSRFHLSEPMKLEFLMGYDGPFRLWLDGKSFFQNMAGINPCLPDESSKTVRLETGSHDIHVGMDLNDGRAWGYLLRLARKDVTMEQICSQEFVKPTYSV
jgi:hypothetical protein